MIRKPFKLLSAMLLFTLPISGCSENKQVDNNVEVKVLNDGEVIRSSIPTLDVNLKDGQEVEILSSNWMDFYYDLKTNNDYTKITSYYTAGLEDTKPINVNITWTNTESDCLYYVLYLSKNISMSSPETFFTQDANYQLSALYAGTHYYYQIHAYYSDYTIVSRKFDFKTVDFFRTLDIDGVQNARDLGNKYTVDGSKRIKQGMAYRTANLQSVTEKGKDQAIGIYGIKTDLDLRGVKDSDGTTPLKNGVNYINNGNEAYGSPYYVGGAGIASDDYKNACKENLKVFANLNNYPIVFHCAVGRDRTGTLAILLELLCGVRLLDIQLDYYSYLFSSITNNDSFSVMKPNFDALISYLSTYRSLNGDDSGDIYERTVNYCKDIGVNDSDISAIRSNLLEEVR